MLDVVVKLLGGSGRGPDIDAAFRAPSGVTALFGRSGAGKTSIVNMLAGLVKPDDGRIVSDDVVLFDRARGIDLKPERRRLGYVFQEALLFPHLTVKRNLLYGFRRNTGTSATGAQVTPERVIDLLRLGDLLPRRIAGLSGGEKQRLAIGRALLANPRILLMDEPLASLDAAHRDEILPFLETLHQSFAIPIVYVTHQIDEIIRLADTMVVLEDGRVMAEGGVEEILARIDLKPLTGRFKAGAAVMCQAESHDSEDGLARLVFPGGHLWVPLQDFRVGEKIRVHIRARDVALALSPPPDTSVLNVLAGTISEIELGDGAHADVLVNVGATAIWSSVTRRSVRELELRIGQPVFAMIKSVAVDRHSLSRMEPPTD